MPALISTDYVGKVVWLGRVPDPKTSIRSVPVETIAATFQGFEGEHHSGLTRSACGRTKTQYKVGTEIRNSRQLSIVGAEDLCAMAEQMGLKKIRPEWLGASMVISGIPDFTLIPPSSRLQTQSGATVTADMENRPCLFPAREIEKDMPGFGDRFSAAARHRRGVVGWVEREGQISVGDEIRLHIPDQPEWSHAAYARQI